MTTTSPANAGTGTGYSDGQKDKDFADFLHVILPSAAETVAGNLGIDPRIAGQTVSDVLRIFGIGGPGKAYSPAVPKEQAISQVRQVVNPYLGDQAFMTALESWLQAAMEPVQAHKEGKDYQPSVDLDKSWWSDAIDSIGSTIGDVVSSVDWRKLAPEVSRVGMQVLASAIA